MTEINQSVPPLSWPNGYGSARKTWIFPYGVLDANNNLINHATVTWDQGWQGSYALNGWLYLYKLPKNPQPKHYEHLKRHWNTVAPKNGSEVPLFMDANWTDLWPLNDAVLATGVDLNVGLTMGVDEPNEEFGFGRVMLNRHRDTVNVAFSDGHVDGVKLNDLPTFVWHH
jgi:prepilin-type processing-associated H-X9-DG protein